MKDNKNRLLNIDIKVHKPTKATNCIFFISKDCVGDLKMNVEDYEDTMNYINSFLSNYDLGWTEPKRICINDSIDNIVEAYYMELQRFYHYGTTREEMNDDLVKFKDTNKEWIEERIRARKK